MDLQRLFINWKTSTAGVLAVALGAAALFGLTVPGTTPMSTEAALGLIVTGIGLVAAKDHNVTGGTKTM